MVAPITGAPDLSVTLPLMVPVKGASKKFRVVDWFATTVADFVSGLYPVALAVTDCVPADKLESV